MNLSTPLARREWIGRFVQNEKPPVGQEAEWAEAKADLNDSFTSDFLGRVQAKTGLNEEELAVRHHRVETSPRSSTLPQRTLEGDLSYLTSAEPKTHRQKNLAAIQDQASTAFDGAEPQDFAFRDHQSGLMVQSFEKDGVIKGRLLMSEALDQVNYLLLETPVKKLDAFERMVVRAVGPDFEEHIVEMDSPFGDYAVVGGLSRVAGEFQKVGCEPESRGDSPDQFAMKLYREASAKFGNTAAIEPPAYWGSFQLLNFGNENGTRGTLLVDESVSGKLRYAMVPRGENG